MAQSDKIDSGYWERYETRFSALEPAAVLELGVLEGASLDLWRERWPGADVVGIDRDPPTSKRWVTYRGEQDDIALLEEVSAEHGGWDLIVDDCEHVGAKTALAFHALWPRLRSGGCYVIEDWGTGYWPGWPDYGSGHSMVDVVKGLIDRIDYCGSGLDGGISSMEFCPGQVFIWKR